MIRAMIAGALIAASMAATPAPKEKKAEPEWKSLGECRISVFCESCNDPVGRQSASGKPLEYGHVAMNDVPLGSKISIEGEIFTVTDRCGIDGTVDVFVPTCDGACHCNSLDYKKVSIKTKGGKK